MPFVTGTTQIVRHEGQVGGGLRGLRKNFNAALAANTPTIVYFGGFRLKDVDNTTVIFSSPHVNGSGQNVNQGGVPATTVAIHSSGEYITLTHTAAMNCSFSIEGDWERT